MGSKMEKLTRKIQASREEIEKQKRITEQLEADIKALDKRRDQAIEQDNLDQVEALTRQRADMMIKLDARRAIDNYKAQHSVKKEDILAAWSEDCKDYQKRITDAENELTQKLIEAAKLSMQLASVASEAYKARAAVMKLAGDNDEAPGYSCPKYDSGLFRLDYLKRDFISESCPGLHDFITQDPAFIAINWMNS